MRAVAHIALCLMLSVPIAHAQTPEDDRRAAKEKFQRAQDLYQQGKFGEAIALLQELRAIRKEPVLLYNLARAYEGQGDLEEALDAYTGYLEEAPDARDRGAIEKRIESIEQQLRELEEKEATPAPAPDTIIVEEDSSLIAIPIAIRTSIRQPIVRDTTR